MPTNTQHNVVPTLALCTLNLAGCVSLSRPRPIILWKPVYASAYVAYVALRKVKKVKSWMCIAHRRETTSNALPFSRKSALISASQPNSQASANTVRSRDTGWCTTRYACLLPSFRWYQIILLGDRGSRVWTTCLRLLRSSVAAGPRTRDS